MKTNELTKWFASLGILSLLAACHSEVASDDSSTIGTKVVGDAKACEHVPLPMIGCANGEGEARCNGGKWEVSCPEVACKPTDCGLQMGLPTQVCSDGSTAGPSCEQGANGKCGWVVTVCPEGVEGSWGGEHAELGVDGKLGGKLELDCAVGSFPPVKLDVKGSFTVEGSLTSSVGPDNVDPQKKAVKAVYSGTVSGNQLKLNVTVDGATDSSSYVLTRNATAMLYRCL